MDGSNITITATDAELKLIDDALGSFAAEPFSFDIAEMLDEDELSEMAELCGRLRQELFGD